MRWITNCHKAEAEKYMREISGPNRSLIIGGPKATETRSAEDLKAWHIVGIYALEDE